MAETNCPNCGKSGWRSAKDFVCHKCGYKHTEPNFLSEISLIFCNVCGCTYAVEEENGGCPTHGISSIKKIIFKPDVS
jgi:hypothetical protein